VLPVDIPPGTNARQLVTEVLPVLHARWVTDAAPADPLSVAMRIEGCGGWTAHIRGRAMRVEEGESPRPTLWLCTSEATIARFLNDAAGPRRLVPKVIPAPAPGGVVVLSDPRVVKRAAMVNGRIELAVIDEDGARLAVVFGFGDAARRPIDPQRPDTVAESTAATLGRALGGGLPPEEALSSGAVAVRGSRLLAMQLALAVAPFYVRR